MGADHICNLLRCNFAVCGRYGKNFMAGSFHRTGLVNIDMCAFRAQDTLIGLQRSSDHRQICLGAAYQKVNGKSIIAAKSANLIRCRCAVFIHTVAGCLAEIGFFQPVKNCIVAAFAVVVIKVNHSFLRNYTNTAYHFTFLSNLCQGTYLSADQHSVFLEAHSLGGIIWPIQSSREPANWLCT